MRKIRIIYVGKNQQAYITDGLSDFRKKIKRYCSFQTITVKEANYRTGNKQKWVTDEGKALIKHISRDNCTVICDERGRSMTSVDLSKKFVSWANNGYSHFDFIIGGAYGLSDEVKASGNLILSLSSMTMTHQLVRLILAEQIYRAFTIVKGEKYHHE